GPAPRPNRQPEPGEPRGGDRALRQPGGQRPDLLRRPPGRLASPLLFAELRRASPGDQVLPAQDTKHRAAFEDAPAAADAGRHQPMTLDASIILALIGVGIAAGVINTIAGGGSFLALPVFIFFGLPAPVANGTNRIQVLLQ